MRRKPSWLRWSQTRAWAVYGVCVLALVVALSIFANNWTTPVYRDGNPTGTALPWTPAQPQPPAEPPSEAPTSVDPATPSEPPTTAPTSPTAPPDAPFSYSAVEIPAVSASGKLYRYLIEVENGVSLNPDSTAETVAAVVND
ncbi:MAG: hypothetical protein LBI99_02435, partial [Propionibacteriaceae bacterium]|nr:hypothetical protein [Propionibacteriaceae bacterium]